MDGIKGEAAQRILSSQPFLKSIHPFPANNGVFIMETGRGDFQTAVKVGAGFLYGIDFDNCLSVDPEKFSGIEHCFQLIQSKINRVKMIRIRY